jgi:hypothetical protein
MAIKIDKPTIIEAAGNKPKVIEEYIGGVNSQTSDVSIARMQSPAGWEEPGQKPEFNEYTVVLQGLLRVRTKDKELDIRAGIARKENRRNKPLSSVMSQSLPDT